MAKFWANARMARAKVALSACAPASARVTVYKIDQHAHIVARTGRGVTSQAKE